MYKNEKIFQGEKNVKYVLKKSYKKIDGLVVIFSAFQPKGSPPTYNYGNTIEEFDCNKLFILDDFGARGSYYLCEERNFSIERSVIGLIQNIIKENDIKRVISAGSSKGGFAALYYGIKYGFDHVIAASPQYFIGDYLLEQTRTNDVVKFMSGNDDESDHQFLNQIMRGMLKESSNRPDIFLHLGKGEMHYKNHVKPMIEDFDRYGYAYTLDLGDYNKHSDVARYFPEILKDKIRKHLDYPDLRIKVEGIDNQYRYTALTNDENVVAWYIYKNEKRIDAIGYSEQKYLDITFTERGAYKVKVFIKNKKEHKISKFSNIIMI